MFSILLGIATCSTLCYRKETTTKECPTGITAIATEEALKTAVSALTGSDNILYVDADIAATFTDTNIDKVSEIISLKSDAAVAVTATLAAAKTTASLTLDGIALTVATSKLTITALTLKSGSTVTGVDLIAISALTCNTFASANSAISFLTGSLTLIGNDLLTKIEGKTGPASVITDGSTSPATLTIPAAVTRTNITSFVTQTKDLVITGDFTDFTTAKFSFNLVFGNAGKAIMTLKADSSPTAVEQKIINVDTYYVIDSSLTANEQKLFNINTDYLTAGGKRKSVPSAAAYCLDQTLAKDQNCPDNAEVLWSEEELANMTNSNAMISLYLSSFTTSNPLSLKLADYKAKPFKFVSTKADAQQNLKFAFAAKDETVTGDFQLDNIKITCVVPHGSTSASIKFNKLLARKADVATEEGVAEEKIPVPFTITVLPGQKITTPVTLTAGAGEEGKAGTVLPFSIDVQDGAQLNVTYAGDWSANKIVVNVGEGAIFDGKKGSSDSDKSPEMESTGAGTAELDGKPVKKAVTEGPTPTPKGGLSGGAIAGIVIACVVVVAAVVVVVVVVIKKKKGKVAN